MEEAQKRKQLNMEECMPYDSTCTEFSTKQNYGERSRVVGWVGWGGGGGVVEQRGLTAKGHEGALGSAGNVPDPDCGDWYHDYAHLSRPIKL